MTHKRSNDTRLSVMTKVFVIVFLLFVPVVETETRENGRQSKEATANSMRERQAVEKKALELLDELMAGSGSLSSEENRAYLMIEASRILWGRDTDRARKYAAKTKMRISALNAKLARGEGLPIKDQERLVRGIHRLRLGLVATPSARDPEQALDYLRATRLQLTEAQKGLYTFNDSEIEMGLTSQIAAKDPQTALKAVRDAFKDGRHGFESIFIWGSLRKKDPQSAGKVAAEIVAQLKAVGFGNDFDEIHVANMMLAGLASALDISVNSPWEKGKKNNSKSRKEGVPEEETAFRELLDLMVEAALKVESGETGDLDQGESIRTRKAMERLRKYLPEIEKRLPARIAAVREKLNQYEKYEESVMRKLPPVFAELEKARKAKGKSVEELLEMAAGASKEAKEVFYMMAFEGALDGGDRETARKILKEHPAAPHLAQSAEIEIIQHAADAGAFDEARAGALKFGTDEEKVRNLARLAAWALSRQDEKTAGRFLDEARGMAGGKAQTAEQCKAQIAVAHGYAGMDPNRSVEILGSVITRLNKTLSAVRDYFDDFEGAESGTSTVPAETAGFVRLSNDLVSTLAQLAHKDFDRAKGLLSRLQNDDVRYKLSLDFILNLLGEQDSEDAPNQESFRLELKSQ